MASSIIPSTILIILSIFLSLSNAQTSFRPRALVVPVQKDAATLQYVTKLTQRTPAAAISTVLDLGGRFLWVDCQANYTSSTYTPARCRSAQCALSESLYCQSCNVGPARPGCNTDICILIPENPIIGTTTDGEVAMDALTLSSTDGSNPGRTATVNQFIFSCARSFHLEGLAAGTVGVAGLGRNRMGMPSQLSAAFSFARKFALCLSGSTGSPGALFFGDGPYNLLPGVQTTSLLAFTPLLRNPISTAIAIRPGEPSSEYFIGVKSIRVNGKTVAVNATKLTISSNGFGGTKLSTVNPYTVLETSIFMAVTEAFITESAARNISRVSGVAPFEVCFSSENVPSTLVGPAVPAIDLVLQNSQVVWTMTGSNSMVSVNGGSVLCLGFVNGGSEPRTSIVIGGKQLEDRLVQIDLATSRVGFTQTLLGSRTTCANFNFTA